MVREHSRRKAQITVFIILGLLVLLAVGIVIYFTSQQIVFRQGVVVPREGQPVYDFVAECMNDVSEEAITILGLQGGFLYLPPDIERTPSAYIPLDPRGVIKVPLWYYEGESRVPSLTLMEADIERYVEENLPVCIDGFSAFSAQYPVVEQAPPDAAVTIGESAVTIRLDYPVQVQRPERIVDLDVFVSQPNVNLKQAYDLAVRVIQRENAEAWFENVTVDFMTMDPAIPFDGLEFDCTPKQWRLTDIKAELQEVLRINLPTIRIEGTQYAPFEERNRNYDQITKFKREDFFLGRQPAHTPIDAYEYSRLRYDVDLPRSQLSAAFVYEPRWGLDINGQPNRGGVLSSKAARGAAGYLSFLCTNFYHFTYDVIYPVMLQARDPEAFLGQGFTFQMAFPVIIDDNEGARKTFGYREFRGFEHATGFCENLGDEVLTVQAFGLDPDVGVVEQDGVTIEYECVGQRCVLGQTQADEGYYRLVTRLPEGCVNPAIVARKDGFLPARAFVTSPEVELTMPRLREMRVQFLKHPYDAASKKFLDPVTLGADENVTVFLSYLNGTFDQFITFPSENNTLQLIDGSATYSLNAILTLFNDYVGGYTHNNLRITGRELAGTDTITINVVQVQPVLQTDQYKTDAASFIAGGTYKDSLKPTYS